MLRANVTVTARPCLGYRVIQDLPRAQRQPQRADYRGDDFHSCHKHSAVEQPLQSQSGEETRYGEFDREHQIQLRKRPEHERRAAQREIGQ